MNLKSLVIGFVLVCYSVSYGAIIQLDSFKDLGGDYSSTRIVSSGSNLLKWINPVTQVEEIVGTNEVDVRWHLGYIDYLPSGGASIVGWGENVKKHWGGDWTGWITGSYTNFLANDPEEIPDDLWVIRDTLGDGIGYFDTSDTSWHIGPDDTLYSSEDILFGPDRIRGDLSFLPAYNGPHGVLYLPEMVIAPIVLGDVNGDGRVDGFDVDPFVDILLNGPYLEWADINMDGLVNGFDVDPFVELVLGNGGEVPGGVEIPEPMTLMLLGLGGFAMIRRRQ